MTEDQDKKTLKDRIDITNVLFDAIVLDNPLVQECEELKEKVSNISSSIGELKKSIQ